MRTYVSKDFGAEFISALHASLGDFEQLRRTLSATGSKKVFVKLRDAPRFQVEIVGSIAADKGKFYSDLADALIEAFEAQGIEP